jgi:predicted permease
LIRYSFGLAIGILLFYILPFDPLFKAILLISLILPIGMAVIPFAVEFELNQKMAGTLANLSIIISFIMMWIIINIIVIP